MDIFWDGIGRKVLMDNLWWPTLFKDTQVHSQLQCMLKGKKTYFKGWDSLIVGFGACPMWEWEIDFIELIDPPTCKSHA